MSWVHLSLAETVSGALHRLFGVTVDYRILSPLGLLAVIGFVCGSALVLIWGERKISARIQNRVGPMMTGPRAWAEKSMFFGGVMQSPADAIKLLIKELIVPAKADPIPFILAPMIIVTVCITAFIVLPFGPALSVADLNIGIVHVISISSLTVLSILMAGWSSNSKYSLLGGLRSAAQMLSYEIPLIFALLGPVVMAGTLSMQGIVQAQREMGLCFAVPSFLGLLIYYVCAIAEVNRPPFDIPEAESELVAGYVSEYSGMMFGMFFLAEFANMFLVCGVAATVFLGGWWIPFVDVPATPEPGFMALGLLAFFAKTSFLVLIMMWIRWTFPRVRPDHLMNLGWKYMLPLSLVNLVFCVAVVMLRETYHLNSLVIAGLSFVYLGIVMGSLASLGRPTPNQEFPSTGATSGPAA